MTTRHLPPTDSLTEFQQRGWSCVWCHAVLGVGGSRDLGEQRVRPREGAAYSWFPRACADETACAERAAAT